MVDYTPVHYLKGNTKTLWAFGNFCESGEDIANRSFKHKKINHFFIVLKQGQPANLGRPDN